jgi:tetratricopeptide (TPR) repeat protein
MKLLARGLRGQEDFSGALKTYEDASTRVEDKAEIQYLIAETYTDMNQFADAVQSYQATIETYDRQERVVPEYLKNAYYKLGTTLFKLNRFGPAIEALKSARELFPDNPLRNWADYLIIEGLEKLGDPAKATEGLNRLVKTESADDLTKQAAEARVKIREWEKQLKEG